MMVLLTSNFFLQAMYSSHLSLSSQEIDIHHCHLHENYETMILFQSRIPHSFFGDLRNHIRSKMQIEKIKWLQVWKVRKIFKESYWFLSLIITKKRVFQFFPLGLSLTLLLLDFYFDGCNLSLSNSFLSSSSLTSSYSCTSI